MMFSKAMIL